MRETTYCPSLIAASAVLTPFTGHARRVTRRGQARRGGRIAPARQRSADIRAWAKEHGISVSERGRIPANVVEQYEAAGG